MNDSKLDRSATTTLGRRPLYATTTSTADSPQPPKILACFGTSVHRIAALLKPWLLGIRECAVSGKHLEYYLDEYTFRFNRRTSRSRGMLFYWLCTLL